RLTLSHRQIYQQLFDLCPPYVLPAPWDWFPAFGELRRPPADAAAAVQALAEKFSSDELHQSGVAVMSAANTVELAPALSDPAGVLFALRRGSKKLPYDLMSERGCLSGRSLAVVRVLRDTRFRRLIDRADGVLCVAFTGADLAPLLSMGMPAVPATGLDQVSRRELDALCGQFGLERISDSEHGPEPAAPCPGSPAPVDKAKAFTSIKPPNAAGADTPIK